MKKILLALTILSIINTGCSKEKGCTDPMSVMYDANAEEDDGSCQYAGSDGSSTIAAALINQNVHIVSSATYPDSAFVKFNAKDSPGTDASIYDMIVIGEAGEDHIHIENLKPGYYWVQCTGFDTTISARVTGGSMVKVSTAGETVNKFILVE